ncbi:GDP-mannose 4,6-dehydratase [Roseisolibacter agri]|uniref:GDP-mannose 4,6-dehydratase n=1 Tax=Roseisolibacter agri TaxID=2014610 RepID=A0AA37Q798_9BACT|nr:GDP-mannose 4,6-dehydratase [Roseisolibacter agri]GLC27564.1 GDP-mannose 4,6-dehydratase [Roseisolibacter agri]
MTGSVSGRALVTGASGFVGRWLIDALAADGWDVTAAAPHQPDAASLSDAGRAARWIAGDVRDLAHLTEALDVARPDAIFHLAGVTFVPAASKDPGATAEVNVVAAARLLGLVRERRAAGTLDPTVLVVGSAEQYGRHDDAELPLTEDAELRPHTVYAATKVAQETMALEAWRSAGVRVIATRSFNHSGPGQASRFLLPGLVGRARKLAAAGASAGPLLVGNQDTSRDFLHVSDVVAAYIALIARGRPGDVYNVASGVGHSVGALARVVLARFGLDVPVESDPALVRPVDVPALVGSSAKLQAHTGWAPRRSFDALLDDLIAAPPPPA